MNRHIENIKDGVVTLMCSVVCWVVEKASSKGTFWYKGSVYADIGDAEGVLLFRVDRGGTVYYLDDDGVLEDEYFLFCISDDNVEFVRLTKAKRLD